MSSNILNYTWLVVELQCTQANYYYRDETETWPERSDFALKRLFYLREQNFGCLVWNISAMYDESVVLSDNSNTFFSIRVMYFLALLFLWLFISNQGRSIQEFGLEGALHILFPILPGPSLFSLFLLPFLSFLSLFLTIVWCKSCLEIWPYFWNNFCRN